MGTRAADAACDRSSIDRQNHFSSSPRIDTLTGGKNMSRRSRKKHPNHPTVEQKLCPQETAADSEPEVTIYTDGSCIYNPGPGGYGLVLQYGEHRKELSAGFRKTTNNRMEIMAAIAGLEALKRPCSVVVWSDSQYLVNAIEKGWAKRWQARSWWRNREERALNPDLWERLLALCAIHRVKFRWLRGHAGHKENERCDQLEGGNSSLGPEHRSPIRNTAVPK
jgi:ribonuclease HI